MRGTTQVWTNQSVKGFAGEADPVSTMITHARRMTIQAMDEGWHGPPFDPAALAHWLNIDVVPREDIRDARTLSGKDDRLRIEFNPNRSRGRIRYSIAHEIAHTFFPDCAEVVRNRSAKSEQVGDEWQLEMLCNIAAAELIMPVGSLPDLRQASLDIDDLMELRREYDVSTEALLLRYIRLTPQSRALFSASRQEQGAYAGRYRIDYAVASSSWTSSLPLGTYLGDNTILSQCTAIGFTAKGSEIWPECGGFQLQCVGIPPYPEMTYPRVIGIVSRDGPETHSEFAIRYLKGDALTPRGDDPRILVHVVNNRSKTWGGGFARHVAKSYPDAQKDFRVWANIEGNQVLGQAHVYGHADRMRLISMVAQRGFGQSSEPRISYPALEECLHAVRVAAEAINATVHMPRIGCGQAGGNWDVVSELIDDTLVRRGIDVTVYDLP